MPPTGFECYVLGIAITGEICAHSHCTTLCNFMLPARLYRRHPFGWNAGRTSNHRLRWNSSKPIARRAHNPRVDKSGGRQLARYVRRAPTGALERRIFFSAVQMVSLLVATRQKRCEPSKSGAFVGGDERFKFETKFVVETRVVARFNLVVHLCSLVHKLTSHSLL